MRGHLPNIPHISLTFIGLMCVLPFLYYYHAHPLTAFYQEWWAAALGLCATSLLGTKRFWIQPAIPPIILLPIGFLLLGTIQFSLGKVNYFDQVALLILYMSWAALLMILGQQLRKEFGLAALTIALAVFLLVGAEVNALAGILQHYRWHTFMDSVVTGKVGTGIYGNLAQPNHFANYITLGLISLGLLHVRQLLRIWQVILLAMPLLFVLVLSGSRSVWLYLIFTSGIAWIWQNHDRSFFRLLQYTLLLLLGFCLMHAAVQIPWLDGATSSTTTMRPLLGEGTSGNIRLYLWREGWQIFSRFPMLGTGFGQFGWQHFQLGPTFQNPGIVGLYNNAHSLIVHLAAEMGAVGLVILLGPAVKWIIQFVRTQRTIYHWWGISVLGVMTIHSLLEYPLWYTYFLGIAAFTLGMLDTTSHRLKLPTLGRLSTIAILLIGALSLMQLLQTYRNLEILMGLRKTAISNTYFRHMLESRIGAYAQIPLRPYFDLLMSSNLKVDIDNLDDKRVLNEKVMYFAPISSVTYREALLLALSGEPIAAQIQMERAIWSYPDGFHAAHKKLDTLAQKNPEIFAALLKFALQKYEERQRAVYTR